MQVELARVEGVAKVRVEALARRVAALEARMRDDARPSEKGQSGSPSDSRSPDDDSLAPWLNEIGRGEDSRSDALIGEIVRFLVRADKTAFAKMYALVKTEAERMDARWNERVRTLYRGSPKMKDSPPVEGKETP
jgi:hypothetical protein